MISTKGRYALRVMIDLAEHDDGHYVPLKEIVERQNMSQKYIESIISLLKDADFVEGLRGKGGGYRLRRGPGEYTVGQIIRAAEGSLSPVPCLDKDPVGCERAAECKTLKLWAGLKDTVNNYLDGITLDEIADGDPADNYII